MRDLLGRVRPAVETVALAGLAGVVFLVPWEELLKLGVGLTLTRVIGLIAAAAWGVSLLGRRERLKVDRSYWWLAAYLAWSALSIIWAKDRAPAVAILATLIQLAVLFVMFRDLVRTQRTFYLILTAYILGAVVASVLAIRFMLSFQEVRASVGRAQNVNNFGREIALALVFAFYLVEQALARWKKAALIVFLAPLLVSLALSQSRGAWVALVLALLVPVLFRNFRVWAAGVVIAVLVFHALGGIAKLGALTYTALGGNTHPSAVTAQQGTGPAPSGSTVTAQQGTQPASSDGTAPATALQPPGSDLPTPAVSALPDPQFKPLAGAGDVARRLLPRAELKRFQVFGSDRLGNRVDIWLVGWELVRRNALVGVGLNNFPARFGEYVSLAHGLTTKLYPGRDPHNTFLSVVGELGLVGLVLFVGWLWSVTAAAWPRQQGQSLTGLIAIALILLGTMTGTDQYMKYFWVALALAPFFPRLTPVEKRPGHAAPGSLSHVPEVH